MKRRSLARSARHFSEENVVAERGYYNFSDNLAIVTNGGTSY
jgi:hypothetical protein